MSDYRARIERLEAESVNDSSIADFYFELESRLHIAALQIGELLQHAREDQIPPLDKMLERGPDGRPQDNALTKWVNLAGMGNSTLPVMTSECVRELLDGIIAADPKDLCFGVCDGCGVGRLRVGSACPHCQSTEWTWQTRLDERPHPWRTNPMQLLGERSTQIGDSQR
jgi:hypothetical protein